MNNNFPLDKDLMKSVQAFDKQRNEELRQMFGKFIKPSLMIRVKEEIIRSPEFGSLFGVYKFNFGAIHALGTDDIDFDVCLNLAMVNWYLLLSVKEGNKHTFYSNTTYIQNIKARTVKQCKLRQLMQNHEEKTSFLRTRR